MANSIDLAEKFQPILDEIYKKESLTARMDAPTKPVDFGGANTVKVYKTSVVGLGTYSRSTGYPVGDVTGEWEDLVLTAERGRELFVDRMDDDETLGMAFGTLFGEFIRTQVVPEVDAYRFSTYASTSSISTVAGADLTTPSAVLAAIDAASAQLDDDEVPETDRWLYIATSKNRLLRQAVTRMLANEGTADRRLQQLDEMTIVPVPQGRFKTAITLDAGSSSSAGGYTAAGGAKNINFMLIHRPAVLQATKHDKLKIFDPDTNQDKDGWKVQYRLYHDAFVYDNHVDGVYLHKAA